MQLTLQRTPSLDIRSRARARMQARVNFNDNEIISSNLVMESMTRFHSVKEHRAHIQTDRNDIRPQTAQFYNERISTDPVLVTWQSTVHGPPEDGFNTLRTVRVI